MRILFAAIAIAAAGMGSVEAATYSGTFVATFTDGLDFNHLFTNPANTFLASGGGQPLSSTVIDGGPIVLDGAFSYNTDFLIGGGPYREVLPYNMQIQLGPLTVHALEGSITLGGGPDSFDLSDSDATIAPADPLDPSAGLSGYTATINLDLSNGSMFLEGPWPGQVISLAEGVTGVGNIYYISFPAGLLTFGDFNISKVALSETSVPDVPTWVSMLVGGFAVGGAVRMRRTSLAGSHRQQGHPRSGVGRPWAPHIADDVHQGGLFG